MTAEALDPESARDLNRAAWNEDRYEGWVRGDGPPAELAAEIAADPKRPLRRLLPHLGDVAGKRGSARRLLRRLPPSVLEAINANLIALRR